MRLDRLFQWRRPVQVQEGNPLPQPSIEHLTDDIARQIRGGDKDYSPTYDYREATQNRFSNASMLLDL